MKNLVKKAWDYVAGNHRYIKYDGSSYHSKGTNAFLQRTDTKLAMLYSATMLGASIYDNGLTDLGDNGPLRNTFTAAADLAIFGVIAKMFDKYDKRILGDCYTKAIDTEGRDLSQKQLSYSDYQNLNYLKNYNSVMLLGTTLAVCSVLALTKSFNFTSLNVGMIALYTLKAERSMKLLVGHTSNNKGYVFCDKPPTKTVKKTSENTFLAGLLKPSL